MKKQTIVLRADISQQKVPINNKKRRRRKNNMSLTYLVMFLFVSAVCYILSITVLFNATEIKINGNTHYTPEQICTAGSVAEGDNLIRLKSEASEQRIEATLVYVDKCEIVKKFPSTIEVNITEAVEAAYVQVLNNYCLISQSGKILENALTATKSSLPVISGLDCTSDAVSTVIQSEDSNKVTIICELLALLDGADLTKVTEINISDRTNILLTYDNRITIKLGSSYDLEYKLGYVSQIINEKLSDDWEGTVVYHSSTAGASAIKKGDELVVQNSSTDDSTDNNDDDSDDRSE